MASATEVLDPRLGHPRFTAALRDVEWRQAGNGQDFTFTGNVAVFNSWSEELWTPRGSFRERILPGAFADVLARKPDVRLLFNHDGLVLARTKSGTLELTEEKDVLRAWARVAPTSYGKDLRAAMERGDIDQMSFAFGEDEDEGYRERWFKDAETGGLRHEIIKVSDLFDVSIVTYPAYVDTAAAMRGLERAVVTGQVAPDVTFNRKTKRAQYRHVSRAISETPWAILPETLGLILSIVSERAAGNRLTDDEIRERIGAKREQNASVTGPVAVLPLQGPIFPRANLFTEMSGATSVQAFQVSLREALSDDRVRAILIDVDSPGGTVDLVPELATEIREARGSKPIVAIANTIAASAAYWIGSAADELVVTPSGEVGSIGVYAAHDDISAWQEKTGVKTTLVSAGKFKTEANPYEPLSDEAREAIQSSVNEFYAMFVAAVAKSRGVSRDTVRGDFGEGRMLSAKFALAAGMVDRIETFEQALARLSRAHGAATTTDLPDEAFATEETLKVALGFAAQVELDPAGSAVSRGLRSADGDTSSGALAETDPADAGVDELATLRVTSGEVAREERERYLRLLKEITK